MTAEALMYRTIADFQQDFAIENDSTLKILHALTDASLAKRVSAEGRTLGRLAWHIVGTLREMPASAGLPTAGGETEAPVPASAAEIASAYERAARDVASAVRAGWTDADLDGEVSLYGETWKRGRVLSALIRHEAHHRGQMTVLMRRAGLKVPGVYGPAREEWAAYGMPAPE
jgi:uncharacterized damage-inducible protein DinB